MKLYHITKDLNHNGVFHPRVPKCRAEIEDSITPRICFSSNIEGALSSIPVPNNISYVEFRKLFECTWKVFEVDTNFLPSTVIVTPRELYEQGKVLDSWLTEEYWVTKELNLSKSAYYISISEINIDEVGEEEQEIQLDCLGWCIQKDSLFNVGSYKRSIVLEESRCIDILEYNDED